MIRRRKIAIIPHNEAELQREPLPVYKVVTMYVNRTLSGKSFAFISGIIVRKARFDSDGKGLVEIVGLAKSRSLRCQMLGGLPERKT